MNRKITGILLAVLLATVGTFALVAYVQSAKDEAVAGERQVDVLVVRERIRKGATLDEVRGAVGTSQIPAKVRPEDAATDLADLDDGLVAAVDLEPGEVLLRSRLVGADDLARAAVPEGMQELTVALEPERAVGGSLGAGDTVGVVLSFEPFERDEAQGGGKTPNMSHLTFHKVVVTSVQFDRNESGTPLAGDGDEDQEDVERAPSNRLLVTLALTSPQVEQVVFAAEFGHIWLTAEPTDADESGTRIVTLGEVYGSAALPGAQP
ncbi:MAG TPA: Flp pilus assembly protein CpaB [Acidimicrobiales bacterium]